MSEQGDDPWTTTPAVFGELLFSIEQITVFQIEVDLNTKFCLDISRLIFGKSNKKFVTLGLMENNSNTEIGVRYFRILKSSINVCFTYK